MHNIRVHGNAEMGVIEVDGELHKCEQCNFSSSFEGNLKVHMRRHESEKLFKCDQCNYKGNQRAILDSHVRSTHSNLWYHCEECDYKASQKCNLKSHAQSVHEGSALPSSAAAVDGIGE